jgi:two-component system CheB/CheR fusion protein
MPKLRTLYQAEQRARMTAEQTAERLARLYDAERDARENLQREAEDRQRAEAALRESEERYRRIVETSAEGIWVIDAESRTTYVNLRMAEMLSCSPQDMLGGYPNDFLFGEDLEAARQEFRLKRQGNDQPFDFRLRRRDGSAIWVRVANRPLYRDNGQFVGVLGMFSDITERQKLEEALRRSEHHYRALADSVPEFVFTCKPDGQCDYCNQRWCDYTGLTFEQTKDFGWSRALHPDDAERSMERLREAFHRGQSFDCEYRIRKGDGSYRWFLTRIVPLHDEQGQVVKWFGICTDIDHQRRLQEALQEADRRKDEFLALLAHELRHPLAAIRNAAEAAKLLDGADTRMQGVAELIARQVQHLSRLVDDLLDVSRITHGKVALHKERMELAAVVTRAVETVRPLIEARQQELTIALLPEPLWLEADATRLVQVLGNLLANATRYTEAGGRIWLTAEVDSTDVILSVRDTGIGIPVEFMPRIFDRFMQGDRSSARSEGGLGIGLTLVKSLVEMHGGSVQASSAGPGKGSEFVVRLPVL